jgi:hypothetical protein
MLDDYFPKCVVDNQEKYKDLIIQDATASIFDFYPEEIQ